MWRQKLPRRGYNTACSDISCRRKRVGLRFCAGKKKKRSPCYDMTILTMLWDMHLGDQSHIALWSSNSPTQLIKTMNYQFQTQTSSIISQEGPQLPLASVSLTAHRCEGTSAQSSGHLDGLRVNKAAIACVTQDEFHIQQRL